MHFYKEYCLYASFNFVILFQEGIEKTNVEALLHRIELGMKHQTTKFGLGLSVVNITPFLRSYPGSSRLYRLDVSQAQKAKESGDERPRLRAS